MSEIDSALVGAVALVGLPGAGKTALAERLCEQLPLHRVDRDLIRAAMFPEGSSSLLEKRAAFRGVIAAVEVNAALGRVSLVDGMPFSRSEDFTRLQNALAKVGQSVLALWLDCPVALAQARVEIDRKKGLHSASDRSADLVTDVAMRFAPPEGAIRLDATLSQDQLDVEALSAVLRRLRLT
jgi:predicted kinase